MSSGNFVYTVEERAALLEQFASVMKITQERQRPAKRISQALQAAIGDDDIIVVPKVIQTPTGKVFHVTGNFASAAEAIAAGNYDLKWGLAETPAKIPLIVQPVDCRVRAIPLGRLVRTGELFELYPRLVDPMTFLTFGVNFPEEQREVPHFTVWKDASGRFWCAVLNVDGAERYVHVHRSDPDVDWFAHYRVLARESA